MAQRSEPNRQRSESRGVANSEGVANPNEVLNAATARAVKNFPAPQGR